MKFIIIAVIITVAYILLSGLMKVAGKDTPSMPIINHKGDKDN